MAANLPERDGINRPFSRVVGEWREAGLRTVPREAALLAPVYETMRSEARAEARRLRRWAGLAAAVAAASIAGATGVAWVLHTRIARLEDANTTLSLRLTDRDRTLQQQTDANRREQTELERLHGEKETLATLLATTRLRVETLREKGDEVVRRLHNAEEREAQARTRWAYAEGERDSLHQQLTELISRIEPAQRQAIRLRSTEPALRENPAEPIVPPPESFGPSTR